MGINIPTKEELIANKPEFKDIAGYIAADSVKYLTIEGLVSAVQEGIATKQENKVIVSQKRVGHCTTCLTGKYPVELEW
ncbi:amidophosphoribosyltransferase-like [Takifugu flavidus]|uniref:amidophosphoribosyltransferase-like n=1 Tax=Takifugu flavidus TaxID=433684 RepID=UPI002544050A|nr:amidophosphoribosyltransferase-like [Takifugu flavidus]